MSETDVELIARIHKQLDRLLQQLKDIEEERESLTEDEYEELHADTVEQLKEMNATLEKLQEGSVSVVDELSAAKMAVRAAIAGSFRSAEILSLLAKKEPAAIRQKLIVLERDFAAKRIRPEEYKTHKTEALSALQKLKEPLTADELSILHSKETPSFDLLAATSTRTCNETVVSNLK